MDGNGASVPRQVLTPPEATELTGLTRHQLLYPLSVRDPQVGKMIRRLDIGIARVLIIREGAAKYAWLVGHPELSDVPAIWRPAVSRFSIDVVAALLGISVSSVSTAIKRGYLLTVVGTYGITMVRRDSLTNVLGGHELRDWPPVIDRQNRSGEKIGNDDPELLVDEPESVYGDGETNADAIDYERVSEPTVLSDEFTRHVSEQFSRLFGEIAGVRSGLAELLEMAKGLPDNINQERAVMDSNCNECSTPVIYAREHKSGYSALLVYDDSRGNIVLLDDGRFYQFVHTNQFNQARAERIPRYRRHDCQSGRSRRRTDKYYSIR